MRQRLADPTEAGRQAMDRQRRVPGDSVLERGNESGHEPVRSMEPAESRRGRYLSDEMVQSAQHRPAARRRA
ncbi:hypothetical protein [Candidatus Nitrospira inopinata]|uniref:Uncharacterized protein n=1 Tax=Candidatus Nitrospira inopinata TaxID=1715989 RepID=A0A0S4KU82_9BACT|nr:hypothetical protein [Candidatus Nitrospira inopinata]CUQ66845.1 protein of unknown function [Candidatus Nitrospira inopinata]